MCMVWQSSHENLNQFSAQRIEKHSFNFNSKLLKTKTTCTRRDRVCEFLRRSDTTARHTQCWPLRRVWIKLFSWNYVGKNRASSYVYTAAAGIYRIPISPQSAFGTRAMAVCVCVGDECKRKLAKMWFILWKQILTNICKHFPFDSVVVCGGAHHRHSSAIFLCVIEDQPSIANAIHTHTHGSWMPAMQCGLAYSLLIFILHTNSGVRICESTLHNADWIVGCTLHH